MAHSYEMRKFRRVFIRDESGEVIETDQIIDHQAKTVTRRAGMTLAEEYEAGLAFGRETRSLFSASGEVGDAADAHDLLD